jgi:hypothetical protein
MRCNTVYTRDEDHTLEPETKIEDCDAEAVPDRDIGDIVDKPAERA